MRALSGELEYRIRYDVEHDLFHAQNVFNAEYIKPIFIEYVQNLEKENAELKASLKKWKDAICADVENYDKQLTKAKEIIKTLSDMVSKSDSEDYFRRDMIKAVAEAEQFLKETK